MHSWPITVLAPIADLALVTRISSRGRSTTSAHAVNVAFADLEFTPGQKKQMPSVCRRPRQRSFSHSQRASSTRVVAAQHVLARIQRKAQAPPAAWQERRIPAGRPLGRRSAALRADAPHSWMLAPAR